MLLRIHSNDEDNVLSNGPRRSLHGLVALCVGLLLACTTQAQTKKPPARKTPAEKPKYEDLTLVTKDGVLLRCTYYPGVESKTTVPLILIHDWDGNRRELQPLALYLQRQKHSVLVPDLRGHGRSTLARGPVPGQPEITIDRDKMKRPAVESIGNDIEAAKRFLMEKNNEGMLNIEQLGLVGIGFGGTLALNWSVYDWSIAPLPSIKRGQDVKALVLVSPEQSFKGVTTRLALSSRNGVALQRLSAMIIAGSNDSSSLSDAKRIHKGFEKYHANSPEKDLALITPNTSLRGIGLLNARGLDPSVPRLIASFVDQRLKKQATRFPWSDRTSPLK